MLILIQIKSANLPWSNYGVLRRYASHSNAILLPKTEFPLRINNKKRTDRDLWITNETAFDDLYKWQRTQIDREEFILHDGPPYANGKPHMGHALNKILKDIILRHQLLSGKKVHYVPGWDCHGLPIEQKALESSKKATDPTPMDIRGKARSFAISTIKYQKAAFKRWGVMADWENDCYYTFNSGYVTNQLKAFYDMYEKGLIFRDYKPVYWSPSSKTALAESELEYNAAHKSTSIYLKLAMHSPLPPCFDVACGTPVYVVVWTTTPWTLPANQAVCYDASKNYSLVRTKHDGRLEYWVLASELISSLQQTWSLPFEAVGEFPGDALKGCLYSHPLKKTELLPLLTGDHVTMSKGTGFVHTAPAHGPEDFLVALQNQIAIRSMVDEQGCYDEQCDAELTGLPVLGEGQDKVLAMVRDDIVHLEPFVHSYPYDWRTKLPVILRASLQWFINTGALKNQALEVMKDVVVTPPNLEKAMLTQLANRPYWCISRQRSWGVPIPVFYRSDGEVLVNRPIIDRLCQLITHHGADQWWQQSADQLLGSDLIKELNLEPNQLQKGQDIMDIWFDSGISWNSVLPEGKRADVYLEGIDQFGGWFQSSLLTSVALTGGAPYKQLFVHGFVLDDKGKKMSKSLGNVVDPQHITDGDGKKRLAYGADVLRWWTASHVTGNGSSVPVSEALIQQAADEVQKLRSIFRFLLGNLQGISSRGLDRISVDQLVPTDRYVLHLLAEFVAAALKAYDELNFKKVASLSQSFMNSQISGFYLHVIRDRLYCHSADSVTRQSAVYVLNEILKETSLILAPLLPHLIEEVNLYYPLSGQEGVFRSGKVYRQRRRYPEAVAWMRPVLTIRDAINQLVGSTGTKDWKVVISAVDAQDLAALQVFQLEQTCSDSPLCELLQVSAVTLRSASCPLPVAGEDLRVVDTHSVGPVAIQLSKTNLKCCPRCRRFTSADGDLCSHCLLMTSAS